MTNQNLVSIDAVENGFIVRTGSDMRCGYEMPETYVAKDVDEVRAVVRKITTKWLNKWASPET